MIIYGCAQLGVSSGEVLSFDAENVGINCTFGKSPFNVYHVKEKGDAAKGNIYFYETVDAWRLDYYSIDTYLENNNVKSVSLDEIWSDIFTKLKDKTKYSTHLVYKDDGVNGETERMRVVVEVEDGYKSCLNCTRGDLWYGISLERHGQYVFITFVESMGDKRLTGEKKEKVIREFVRWNLEQRASQCEYS